MCPHLIWHVGWLGMELDVKYVTPVFNALNSTKQPLQNRGLFRMKK